MDLNFPQTNSDIRAQIQLLKAHMSHKTNLQYEISQIKIKNSYRQSNSDYRDSRDMGNLTKLLGKRLIEVRNMAKAIRSMHLKQVSKETLASLIESFRVLEPQLDISRNLFSLNFQIEADIDTLKTYYLSKSQELDEKSEVYQENQDYLDQTLRQSNFLESLENEVNDYTAELEQFSIEIQALQEKKMKIMNRRRTSVDKVKIFHQLSDLALSFRSKLLLREELKKNLKNAESELEDLFRKVNEEQEKLQIIEAENESDKKYASRYEVDLDELQKNIEKKKKSLEKLLGEKKALISDEGNKEGFEEGETVFLSGWVNGMNEMQKEKISLMEENFKLKERISRLYSPKA
jgi:hypothetical protein